MSAWEADAAEDTNDQAFARFERAKRANAKCATKQLAIRDELRRIKQRKIELGTMEKMNNGQRDSWLEELIETTIIPYSKAWNRKFADQIHKTFPPEVRSIIYSYLMDTDTWEQWEHAFMAVTSVLPPYIGHCSCLKQPHGVPRVPHFLFPEYMGGEAAVEVVERLYRSEWFDDQTLYGQTADLNALINTDAFGAGFDPASLIQSLSIVCDVDQYRRPRPAYPCKNCRHTPYERRYIDQDRLKSEFDQLLGLVDSENFFHLEVTFIQRNIRIDVLEEALEAFRNVHQAFRQSDAALYIQWSSSSFTCGQKPGHAHGKDLSKFFTEPRYTWKHRMLQFLEQLKPCMEARHIKFINEPSLGLSDADFVHRMWDADETFDPEDEEEDDEESALEDESLVGCDIRPFLSS